MVVEVLAKKLVQSLARGDCTSMIYASTKDIIGPREYCPMIENKELTVVKTQITKATSAAQSLTIEDADGMARGSELLLKIKEVGKFIKERMEAPVKRAYQAYKDIKDEQEKTFGAYVKNYEDAERLVKTKMVEYQTELEKKAKEEELRLAQKVQSGYLKPETAIERMAAIEVPENKTKVDGGTVSFRIDKIAVIDDKSKLPLEFLLPDMVAINRAIREGREIPGVRVEERKVVVAR